MDSSIKIVNLYHCGEKNFINYSELLMYIFFLPLVLQTPHICKVLRSAYFPPILSYTFPALCLKWDSLIFQMVWSLRGGSE